MNDYIETAKLLGVEIKKEGDDEKKGLLSGDGKGGDKTDMTDPTVNDLIPQA